MQQLSDPTLTWTLSANGWNTATATGIVAQGALNTTCCYRSLAKLFAVWVMLFGQVEFVFAPTSTRGPTNTPLSTMHFCTVPLDIGRALPGVPKDL